MYDIQSFAIPELKGISQKNIEEHLKLYAGYVKNTNAILEKMTDNSIDSYAKSEMQRRFSFEFNGMKNHEYYFSALEGGASQLDPSVPLYKKIEDQFGSFDSWMEQFKTLAKTRGVGWAILYYDSDTDTLLNIWVDEQHLGHLNSCHYVFGIDMWEHSFVADYQPSGKGDYINDYLSQVNWSSISTHFNSFKN